MARVILFQFLVVAIASTVAFDLAHASIETRYKSGHESTLAFSQRAQEESGYASGFYITELDYSGLVTPHFEVGFRFRFLTSYGPGSVVNFARSGDATPGSSNNPAGIDRPILRARQLIYGDFSHGRWFIMELGLALFNVSGFTPEYYRYWSGHIALHELLNFEVFNPYFELGASVRSLSQFKQPENAGIIYPPTINATAGIEKDFHGIHLATDFKIEQALSESSSAGSYQTSVRPPLGATSQLFWALETGYRFKDERNGIFLRAANRIFRWPEDDSAALWSTFEEGSLGRSLELQWRTEW